MGIKLCTLAYVRSEGRTLMLKRPITGHHQAGKYNGLGGKFEPGESPEECLRREVLEESGLVVESADLKGFITFPDFDGADDWYVFVYVVTRFSGEVASGPEGELEWVDDDVLADLPLWEGDRHFLPWLSQAGIFSATFRYEGGRFVSYEVVRYGAARVGGSSQVTTGSAG
ncbi:MAG TPA: 8-oxo-dGTP diphosphatase [Trueperaceae bacterium]|nr:8-oxo-dGTP diphosphatase [Trueperaceae bacterium]